MSATTSWKVQGVVINGSSVVYTDLQDRTLGFQIRQEAPVGRMGSSRGTLQLDNNDNALTPEGGGSLQAYEWFNAVFLFKLTSVVGGATLESDVCFMVCTNIAFNDDGGEATVTLSLSDPFIYAARDQVTGVTLGTIRYAALDQLMLDVVNGYSSGGDTITGVSFPRVGASNDSEMSIERGNNDITVAAPAADNDIGYTGGLKSLETGTARDFINNQILPTGPGTAFPANVATPGSGGSLKWNFNAYYINRKLTKETVDGQDKFERYVFKASPSAGEFPIMRASTQFNSSELVNQSTVQAQGDAGDPVISNNTTSQQGNGVRSVTYNNVIIPQADPSQTAKTNIGEWWTKRYNNVSFITQRITTSVEAIEPYVTDASQNTTFTDLLSGDACLWSYAEATITPKGASSAKTYKCVIVGRNIHATPSNTMIEFDLVNAVDNQSLKLNSSYIGILNTNRLG